MIQKAVDKEYAKIGVKNIQLPLFIKQADFMKEKEHVEGFAPELYTVGTNKKDALAELDRVLNEFGDKFDAKIKEKITEYGLKNAKLLINEKHLLSAEKEAPAKKKEAPVVEFQAQGKRKGDAIRTLKGEVLTEIKDFDFAMAKTKKSEYSIVHIPTGVLLNCGNNPIELMEQLKRVINKNKVALENSIEKAVEQFGLLNKNLIVNEKHLIGLEIKFPPLDLNEFNLREYEPIEIKVRLGEIGIIERKLVGVRIPSKRYDLGLIRAEENKYSIVHLPTGRPIVTQRTAKLAINNINNLAENKKRLVEDSIVGIVNKYGISNYNHIKNEINLISSPLPTPVVEAPVVEAPVEIDMQEIAGIRANLAQYVEANFKGLELEEVKKYLVKNKDMYTKFESLYPVKDKNSNGFYGKYIPTIEEYVAHEIKEEDYLFDSTNRFNRAKYGFKKEDIEAMITNIKQKANKVKSTVAGIMKEAHRLAKELKEEFPNIDYKAQVGINIRYLLGKELPMSDLEKETKELDVFVNEVLIPQQKEKYGENYNKVMAKVSKEMEERFDKAEKEIRELMKGKKPKKKKRASTLKTSSKKVAIASAMMFGLSVASPVAPQISKVVQATPVVIETPAIAEQTFEKDDIMLDATVEKSTEHNYNNEGALVLTEKDNWIKTTAKNIKKKFNKALEGFFL